MDKLTDEEIIRGAECCKDISQCKDCPYKDTTNCVVNLINDIYDLTNRQNAEMERLLKQLKEGVDLSDSVIRDVKSEAIKEFIEKLDERLTNYGIYSQYVKDTIRQIVKEMKVDYVDETKTECKSVWEDYGREEMRSEENEFRKRN